VCFNCLTGKFRLEFHGVKVTSDAGLMEKIMLFKRSNRKSYVYVDSGRTCLVRFMTLSMCLACLFASCTYTGDVLDSDGDGLSDFQEIHKYLTDPARQDTDGDGVPDGDWNERREYSYSVRSILQFMPPFDKAALNDDFQDARVLEERDDYIEVEVIHYPLNTVGASIDANPNWQTDYVDMTRYLKPGITTNWDDRMRRDLLAELKADGIIINKLVDKEVVEKVSSWLMKKSQNLGGVFTTYYIHYPDGKPSVYPGLGGAFESEFNKIKDSCGWTSDQHFDYELLGRGMFRNKTYGTCTSFAVYMTTVLRAVGIPTRMIIVIPAVDPSDDGQVDLVRERITHNQVRETMLAGLSRLGRGFAAHTFNEVYVGNGWHRLNYGKLGQPVLDRHLFGLHTHLYTFNDLGEANLAPTWGRRYGRGEKSAVLKHNNPYTAVTLSDLFGCHSSITNPAVPVKAIKGHEHLTISKAYWFHSSERPGLIPSDAVPDDTDGHILFHVDEWFGGEDIAQYRSFYNEVDKGFVLKSEGYPDLYAFAERGYWGQEFYIRVPEKEYTKMEVGVPYTVCPVNSNPKKQWKVSQGVTIRKLRESGRYRPPNSLPNIFIMSPSWPPFDIFGDIRGIVEDVTYNKTGRYHEKKSYDDIFIAGIHNRKPGDIIVLLFSLDAEERIPVEYEDLLPKPWSEIEAGLKQGEAVELSGKARDMNIILLAAPKRGQLKQLIGQTKLLKNLEKYSRGED